jgi:cytochrome c
MKMNKKIPAAALAALIPFGAWAQSNCHQPTANEYRLVKVVDVNKGLEEEQDGRSSGPMQMAIAPDGRIFVGKMKTGEIRVIKPTNTYPTTADLVGVIPTWMSTEDGLLGIALDPNFATNHWLYAYFSDPCGKNCTNRAAELSRFTISADNKLGPKKVIMRHARASDDDHHAAGGLSFDASGVLVIGTGDNTDPHNKPNNGYGPLNFKIPGADAQRTSSNTNDLRGKILRIKPKPFADAENLAPGVGTTYEIPAGNLWEIIDNKSFNPGWSPDSDNVAKVRKEIFTFGHRNPYRVRVDSKSGWIFWGEVGPDAGEESGTRGPTGHDEWNLALKPGFFGHPYCNGYNKPYNMLTGMTSNTDATYGAKYNCAALENHSPNNTGIKHIPPAVPALVAYASGNSTDDDARFNFSPTAWTNPDHSGETAVGGPMYRYDPLSTSAVRFPPYFEGKVLFFDWNRLILRFITLNPDGTIPAGKAGVENFAVAGLPLGSYIDQQYGPDGAMYLLRFSDKGYGIGAGPQLYKVEYTGPQDVSCYQAFTATVGPTVGIQKPALRQRLAPLAVSGIYALPAGYRNLSLFDMSGRKVWSYRRDDAARSESVRLPSELAHGLWQATVMP